MADLELLGVSKIFADGTKAVDRLEILVRDGELLVLVGPSGSGKTTTLRLIAGLEQPTSGEIRIAGRDVTQTAPRQRDVAMVFQDLGLYGHLSVRQNIAFGLRLRQKEAWLSARSLERLSAAQIDERVDQAASMLGIETLLERRPAELSGGQQQRVALGRAIVRRPQAMLLDEPLASLDAPMRRELRRELRRLHRELELTMVYVTHDQAEAMALGDRIAVMNEGRMEQVDTPEDVYRRPATKFVAGFFGSHGMNFVTGELDRDSGRGCVVHSGVLPIPTADWPANALIDGKVMIGFRPEDAVLLSSVEPGQLAWEAEVVAVEYQGEASYATVRPLPEGRETCIVRVESRDQITSGEHRLLTILPGHLHWFGSDGKQFA